MNGNMKLFEEHLNHVDKFLAFNSFSNDNLVNWLNPVIESITEDGAVPYLIGGDKRFRASPTASTIFWLDNEGLLPLSILEKMQAALLYLRDNEIENEDDEGIKKKFSEDNAGWSLAEGVSVWSTCMAILALLDNHGIGVQKANQFKDSVLWLANQRNVQEKGWGYQKVNNCETNVIMTALSVRALSLAFSNDNKSKFSFTSDEEQTIKSSIIGGAEYLKSKGHISKKKAYWEFQGVPHCTATIWTLLAFRDASKISGLMPTDFDDYYNKILNRGLSFILATMPKDYKGWGEEKIVEESGAKYNKQKNYYSYLPTLIPQILSLGESPFHYKIINQIRWLINNKNEWKMSYDKDNICTFTYAMVIATIASWVRRVGTANAVSLLRLENGIKEKFLHALLGCPKLKDSPLVLINKNRIISFCSIFVSLILILCTWELIGDFVKWVCVQALHIWEITAVDRHNIAVNIISSAIYAVLAFFVIVIYKAIKNIKK